MKLLTHNMLQCHIKGVKNGYPLKIEAEKVRSTSKPGQAWAAGQARQVTCAVEEPGAACCGNMQLSCC